MTYCETHNYLFTSNFKNGTITVFDVGKPGREKFTKGIGNYPSKAGSRELVYLSGRSEFAVGLSDGNISFWNFKKGEPICKFN